MNFEIHNDFLGYYFIHYYEHDFTCPFSLPLRTYLSVWSRQQSSLYSLLMCPLYSDSSSPELLSNSLILLATQDTSTHCGYYLVLFRTK